MDIARAATAALLVATLCCVGSMTDAATYYVSRSTGSDTCDGLAPARRGKHGPWQTLEKASAADYLPGDRLLLRCGDSWNGGLTLRNDANAATPITLAAYGKGARPRIVGRGAGTACVTLDRCAGWRIVGLELARAQNAIRVVADSRTRAVLDGLAVEDCYLHHIENPAFPDPAKREGSQHNHLRRMGYAIFVDGFESPAAVELKHVHVRHCVAAWCQGFYIHVMGPIHAQDVVFDANTLAHISYNAIYQAGARGFSITSSALVYGYPWASYPNGATQALAGGLEGDASARNVVSGNEFGWGGEYPACPDGCGYDFEGSTSGVAFRNNLLHDTYGEPVLFMGNCRHQDLLFDNNVLRDCVRWSTRWHDYVTCTASNTGNGTFSNNRFYLRPGQRAFSDKPASFSFVSNQENATGDCVAMPVVTRIARSAGARTYALACRTPGAVIRYTLDGSLPTAHSTPYTRPVRIARSCALNAKAFRDGMDPSYVNSLVVDLGDAEGRAPAALSRAGANAAARSGTVRDGQTRPIADTFTLAFWVAPDTQRASVAETDARPVDWSGQRFVFRAIPGDGPAEATTAVSVGTNGVTVFECAAGYLPCMLNVDAPLAGWHHVAVVYHDRQPALYLDGVYQKAGLKSTRTVRPTGASGSLAWHQYLAHRSTKPGLAEADAAAARTAAVVGQSGPAPVFTGKVGEVRLYDRVLTDAEIQELATARPVR